MPSRSDRNVPRRKTADDAGVHVNFIMHADMSEQGNLVVRTRGSSRPQTLRALKGVAGRQLSLAMLDHLHLNGGTWTSSATLKNQHYLSSTFLAWLADEAGIHDLSDPAFDPATAWQGVLASSTSGTRQRQFRTFLAEALRSVRDDHASHRSVLHGRSLPVAEHDLQGYAPDVADAIEGIAKDYVGRWFVRHRDAVRHALGGNLPRDWMHVPATDLRGAESPLPDGFVVTRHDLAAAMVLLSLLDDKGPNLSVIQSHTSDSVEAAGDTAFVTSVKARNRQVLRSPAPRAGCTRMPGCWSSSPQQHVSHDRTAMTAPTSPGCCSLPVAVRPS